MQFEYTLIILVILAFLLLLIMQFKINYNIEGYNWGTIDQLNAKDQQDTYLTGNSIYPNYPFIPYDPLRPKKSQYNLYNGFNPNYAGYNGVMFYQ